MIFCDEKIKTLGRRISDPSTANNRKASSLKTAQHFLLGSVVFYTLVVVVGVVYA